MPDDPRRRTIYRGRIVDLGLETVTLPNGHTTRLEIVRHPGAAAVVPLHDDGSVTLIRQYRHAAGGRILEVPAGTLEPGEVPDLCARRELAEEVGLSCQRLERLTILHTTPGFTDERIWVFLATGLAPAEGRPDPDEVIEPVRMSLAEALAACERGDISDAKTLVALLLTGRRLGV